MASAWTLVTSGQVASIASRLRLRACSRSAPGDLVEVFYKDDAAILEAGDHVAVVDDLVKDVDRLAGENVQDLIDHVDRHAHAGAEAAWIGQQDPHG